MELASSFFILFVMTLLYIPYISKLEKLPSGLDKAIIEVAFDLSSSGNHKLAIILIELVKIGIVEEIIAVPATIHQKLLFTITSILIHAPINSNIEDMLNTVFKLNRL